MVRPAPSPGARMCSTPFGITEVGTWRAGVIVDPGRLVLNAFRHHRGGRHAEGRAGIHRLVRAQRLSASQRWAHQTLPHPQRQPIVLNAFRHHRGGRDRVCDSCLDHVLSAQRLSASQRWARVPPLASSPIPGLCSTPFGITEVGASFVNATTVTGSACSTPFGITEVGTPAATTALSPTRSAQRLSASQRWALLPAAPWLARVMSVLNAFRHHRGGRKSTHSRLEVIHCQSRSETEPLSRPD